MTYQMDANAITEAQEKLERTVNKRDIEIHNLKIENKRLRDALQGVRGDLVLLQMAIEHQANDAELLRRIALMEADMKKLPDLQGEK